VSEYFANCEPFKEDFGDLITIGDPNNRFMITLPYKWDIREFYTDTLYGIYASNSLDIIDQTTQYYSLSISGYQTNKTLENYYQNELVQLNDDPTIEVEETGTIAINEKPFPWVLFKLNGEPALLNIVTFIKSEQKNSIYLIQISVEEDKKARDSLCNLKQFVCSFELIE
jgi:hypothetical protein